MTRLRWQLTRAWQRVTPAQLVLAALVLLAALLEVLAIQPLQAQWTDAQMLAESARIDAAKYQSEVNSRLSKTQTARQELLSLLPPAGNREQALREPELLAHKHQLRWMRTEYRVDTADAALPGIERVVVRCTLEGSYPALRAFIHSLLANTPNLAIDNLSVASSTSALPSLNLEISLYFRTDIHGNQQRQINSKPALPSGKTP